MPVAQNIHAVFLQPWPVENNVRTRNEFAHTGSLWIRGTNEREILQNRNAVKQRVANANRCSGIVLGDVTNGRFQIRDSLRREDYFAAHEPTRLRASSSETPLPASTSPIAASSDRSKCSFSWADISV